MPEVTPTTNRAEDAALGQAARRFARFLDIPLTLTGPLRS